MRYDPIKIPAAIEKQMPKSVPLLTRANIYVFHFVAAPAGYRGLCLVPADPGESRCLIDWCRHVFTGRTNRITTKTFVLNEMVKAIHWERPWTGISFYNDVLTTKAQAARLWNRLMRNLGYTEILK